MTTRRNLLLGAGATLGALAIPRPARAAVSGSDRKFIFLWADGGWDPTKCFATVFGSTDVERDGTGDTLTTFGDLSFVDNPNRLNVGDYFARYGSRTALLNGMLIRSINHPICRRLALTNSPNGTSPDWPTLIGFDQRNRYTIPHLVAEGPSFAAELSAFTALSGSSDELADLIDGTASLRGDNPISAPSASAEAIMDRYLVRRAAARTTSARDGSDTDLSSAFFEAIDRLVRLKEDTRTVELGGGGTLEDQMRVAVSTLSSGISRCVTITAQGNWDTHVDNSAQSGLFDSLFGSLSELMLMLETTRGAVAPTLAEETVVVVLSEMGRTPFLNSTGGKDHFPYTSFMLMGSGIRGGQMVGGYDENLNGLAIDIASGARSESGSALTPDVLGATLMTLADIDPLEHLDKDNTLRSLLT